MYQYYFHEADLQERLITLLSSKQFEFSTKNGSVVFDDIDSFDIIVDELRNELFQHWIVLTCPSESTDLYIKKMEKLKIPYHKALVSSDTLADETEFLLPEGCRPHTWKL